MAKLRQSLVLVIAILLVSAGPHTLAYDVDGGVADYEQAKRHWLNQVNEHNEDTAVLSNAVNFLQLHDKALAEEILFRASELEPGNPQWSVRLGYLYALAILGVDGLGKNRVPTSFDQEEPAGPFAQKAWDAVTNCNNPFVCGTAATTLFQYGMMLPMYAGRELKTETRNLSESALLTARKLQPENPMWLEGLSDFYRSMAAIAKTTEEKSALAARSLPALEQYLSWIPEGDDNLLLYTQYARAAYTADEKQKAMAAATELLKLAAKNPDNSAYGPAVHYGNLILGSLALHNNQLDVARASLLRAGRIPGGGTLSSFGPNMALAKEMLEQGETEVVLEYLELCKVFWISKYSGGRPEQWIRTIKAGDMPDFGANLRY